jgi:TolB protein
MCLAVSIAAAAGAQDTVRLIGTYDPSDLVPIALLPVAGANGDSIVAMLERDLQFSDRVRVTRADAGVRTAAGLDYAMLAAASAKFALDVTMRGNTLHFVLHDVATRQVAKVRETALAQPSLSRPWRRGIHMVADDVVEWLTNERGIAATRVAYVYRNSIRIADSDGAGDIVTAIDSSARSPSWSLDGASIVVATFGVESRIIVVDVESGRSRVIAGPEQNNTFITPVFSRDGRSVVFAKQSGVGSNIYSVPVSGGSQTRITNERYSINMGPTLSRDGRRAAFVSDRTGRNEVMVMDADGTNAEVLTDYPGDKAYRADPDWSPDGRLIAYQDRLGADFQLRVISPAGKSPRTLTDLRENEQPAWAPDSRHIVFTSTRTGSRELWVVDVLSSTVRQLTHRPGAKSAAWSPRP